MENTKTCYMCEKELPANAVACPHCGEYLKEWPNRELFEDKLEELTHLQREWDQIHIKAVHGRINNVERYVTEEGLDKFEQYLVLKLAEAKGIFNFNMN